MKAYIQLRRDMFVLIRRGRLGRSCNHTFASSTSQQPFQQARLCSQVTQLPSKSQNLHTIMGRDHKKRRSPRVKAVFLCMSRTHLSSLHNSIGLADRLDRFQTLWTQNVGRDYNERNSQMRRISTTRYSWELHLHRHLCVTLATIGTIPMLLLSQWLDRAREYNEHVRRQFSSMLDRSIARSRNVVYVTIQVGKSAGVKLY